MRRKTFFISFFPVFHNPLHFLMSFDTMIRAMRAANIIVTGRRMKKDGSESTEPLDPMANAMPYPAAIPITRRYAAGGHRTHDER
jgi:hypothetical protein